MLFILCFPIPNVKDTVNLELKYVDLLDVIYVYSVLLASLLVIVQCDSFVLDLGNNLVVIQTSGQAEGEIFSRDASKRSCFRPIYLLLMSNEFSELYFMHACV